MLRSGDAFNVVPGAGELFCDLRADDLDAIERVLEQIPAEIGGATLHPELIRRWPGMRSEKATAPLLERASALLGRRIAPAKRGGASDASHFAATIRSPSMASAPRWQGDNGSSSLARAPAKRGGASDASHFAATIPVTVDGLGPRGGKAHNPEEFVLEASLQPRAEVALALILAALADAT